ncbi:MAG: PH domain-containing protein [Bacteroidota bacterium]
MPTIDEIKSQIKNIGHLNMLDKLFGFNEIKELPNIIQDDERIENIIQGEFSGGNGILVATNNRLIFLNKKLFGSLKLEEITYNEINKIHFSKILFLGKIVVHTTNKRVAISDVADITVGRRFVASIEEKIASLTNDASKDAEVTQKSGSTNDTLAQLERLGKLKAKGLLTEEEFNSQKSKILNS